MLNQEISVKLFDDHSTILFCWPPAGDNANGFVFWRPPSDWRSWSSNWNRLWSRVIRWFLLIGVIIRPAPSDGLNQGKITLFLLGRASGKEGKCWNTVFGGPLWYQFHVKEKVKKISVRQMTGRVPDVACVSINFPMADRPVLRHHHHIGKFLPDFPPFWFAPPAAGDSCVNAPTQPAPFGTFQLRAAYGSRDAGAIASRSTAERSQQ